MNVRSLLLAALTLGCVAGCNNRPPSSSPPPASEPGTAAAAPEAQPSQPPPANEPGTAAAPGNGQPEVKPGESAVYLVRDSGIRCIAPPCPSYTAARVDKPGTDPLLIHELDLSAVSGGSDERAQSLTMQTTQDPGLKVEATLDTRPNAGPSGAATVLRVTKLSN